MNSKLRALAIAGIMPACLLSLTGCTKTLDPSSAVNLIKSDVSKSAYTLKSANCPSGIQPKQGATFDCKVTVTDSSGGIHSGTITIHFTGGGKEIQIFGPQDVHIPGVS